MFCSPLSDRSEAFEKIGDKNHRKLDIQYIYCHLRINAISEFLEINHEYVNVYEVVHSGIM